MSRAENITSSESTKKQARALDDTKERVQIRRESRLERADHLSEFERLVKAGELELHELPQDAFGVQVGQETYIERGQKAYGAWAAGIYHGQQTVYVDLDASRSPVGGFYKVIFQGPASEIKYRHPKSNKILVGSSELIHFVILKRKDNQIALRDPRI